MKKSIKGALLSGLLFPGAGQLWLKHPIRGVAWILIVATSLALIVVKVAKLAMTMLEKLESEGGAIDLVAIVNSAHAASYDDSVMKCASLLLIVSWIASIIDAFMIGRKQDLEDQKKVPGKSYPGTK